MIKIHNIDLHHEMDTVIRPGKKYKWTDIYDSENEIINDLKLVDEEVFMKTFNAFAPWYKGYEFIHSFSKQIAQGKTLSPKQMTQCKRLASEIKKAAIFNRHFRANNKDMFLQALGRRLIGSKYKDDQTYYKEVERFLDLNYGLHLNDYDYQEIYDGENYLATISIRHNYEDEVTIEDIMWESE